MGKVMHAGLVALHLAAGHGSDHTGGAARAVCPSRANLGP